MSFLDFFRSKPTDTERIFAMLKKHREDNELIARAFVKLIPQLKGLTEMAAVLDALNTNLFPKIDAIKAELVSLREQLANAPDVSALNARIAELETELNAAVAAINEKANSL